MTLTLTNRQNVNEGLEEIRLDIDRGLSSAAQERISSYLKQNRRDPELVAKGKCLLSESLELQGRHQDAVHSLEHYLTSDTLKDLELETQVQIKVRLALAYNYTGDFPKAIGLIDSALRDLGDDELDEALGSVHLTLSRIYRTINEYRIARDHALKALSHFRSTGNWRGLAESYFAVALVELFEGEYHPALEHLEQVLLLVGDRSATYLLGMTYTNLAAVCGFIRQPHEGIAHLEKAVNYYETTEHKTNAIAGHNNLGVHLTLLGDWTRAEEEFKKALELAESIDSRSGKLPMVLDSLGELKVLQGELGEARVFLDQAVEIAKEHGNRWYEWQSRRTLGKCCIAENDSQAALENARKVLRIGEEIGDRQAIREAHLLAAEAHIQTGGLEKCEDHLRFLRDEGTRTEIDLGLLGELHRLQGVLEMSRDEDEVAIHHFGKSISIFEMLGDRYSLALARYWLGFSYRKFRPAKAKEFILQSIKDLAALGARIDLNRAKDGLSKVPKKNKERAMNTASLIHSLMDRLTDSFVSGDLLLRELASVLWLETDAKNVLIISPDASGRPQILVRHGFQEGSGSRLEKEIERTGVVADLEKFCGRRDLFFRKLAGGRAHLMIAPASSAALHGGLSLDPLLRIVEIGLNSDASHCVAARDVPAIERMNPAEGNSANGFVYASPAMEKLVEEIRKIRSSDVTVLITGESGTGKELVAQSIHRISARNDKTFIPFNCTAVPKDLADAYLFGYRKGAFTGAATGSDGVIRAATGGTLFLDEIGDLPLDIQPKLLRFLQEGEIQPLGESHPVKVDVRIVAATNSDLERKVSEGLFREDLFYRLNVIRLHVPPLKSRRSDIPVLVDHYVRFYSSKFGRENIVMTAKTIDFLTSCEWQGNVRQLCNEIQRIVARTESNSTITPDDLSPELRTVAAPSANSSSFAAIAGHGLSMPEAIEKLEKEMIGAALERNKNNISRSANDLGITRRGLQLKLHRYSLKRQ